jgi:hypothetical protein
MTEATPENDQQAVRAWYKKTLDGVVKEMLKKGVLAGVTVDANPVWAAPYKILIAKVWNFNEKSRFIWTISGERVITDHIAGSVAKTPKEAARHFSLKWQMDADRLSNIAQAKAPAGSTEASMERYTKKLIDSAELLYDLSSRDDIWKPKHH